MQIVRSAVADKVRVAIAEDFNALLARTPADVIILDVGIPISKDNDQQVPIMR